MKQLLLIEINLLLWLCVAGHVTGSKSFEGGQYRGIKVLAWVGVLYGAIIQHWVYYRFIRPRLSSGDD